MNIVELRSFTAIVDWGGFRRAAERVGLPQPTVTAHVKRLEDEIGWPLLDRTQRPVALTSAGQAFVPRARQMLALYDDALREVQDLRQTELSRLSVGFMHYLSHLNGPQALVTFRSRWPDVSLTARVGTTRDLVEMLGSRDVDIAFVHRSAETDSVANLEMTTLRHDRLVILSRREDPATGRVTPTLSGLARVPVVRFRPGAAIQAVVDMATAELGLEFVAQVECADMASAVACVRLGLAVAIVPETFARQQDEA